MERKGLEAAEKSSNFPCPKCNTRMIMSQDDAWCPECGFRTIMMKPKAKSEVENYPASFNIQHPCANCGQFVKISIKIE